MITSAYEYLSHLQEIQNINLRKERLNIPEEEPVYEIDLNTRTIETPTFLSVETDHTAETIFFKVDRYFDTVDLAESTCIIQYVNAKGKSYIYAVPIYDTQTLAAEGKMLIPWTIQGPATVAAGTIKYAIRFYHIHKEPITIQNGNEISDIEKYNYYFDYIINTIPSTSRILSGLGDKVYALNEAAFEDELSKQDVSMLESILARLTTLENSNKFNIY